MAAPPLRIAACGPAQWFEHYGSRPSARARLFCFPHVGGGAPVFAGWRNGPLTDIEVLPVQLPGRDRRMSEPPYSRLTHLVQDVVAVMPSDKPFALFGHSMGALVCFEVARELRRQGLPAPFHIFASAAPAPHLPRTKPPRHVMSDEELAAELRQLGGTSEAVLENPELMRMFLPVLRADFAMLETYTYSPERPLASPISVLAGSGDGEVCQIETAAWNRHSSSRFGFYRFAGGHFFIHDSRSKVLTTVKACVDASLAASRQMLESAER